MAQNTPMPPDLRSPPEILSALCPIRRLVGDRRREYHIEHCALPEGHPSEQHYLLSEHRLVWEQVHGFVPSRCIVYHKDGNSLNNDPDNLDCMTKKDYWRQVYSSPEHCRKRGWRFTQQGWKKCCTKCHVSQPVEQFDAGRRVCRACRRRARQKRHRAAYQAPVFRLGGQTYSLGAFGEACSPAHRQDALFLLTALLEQELREDLGGDLAAMQERWASLAARLPN